MEPTSIVAVATLPQLLVSILLFPWNFAQVITDQVLHDFGCNDGFAVVGIAAVMSFSYVTQDTELVQPGGWVVLALASLSLLQMAVVCHAFDPVKELSAVLQDFVLRTGALGVK